MGIFAGIAIQAFVCTDWTQNYRRATDTQALRHYLENKMTLMILEAERVKSR